MKNKLRLLNGVRFVTFTFLWINWHNKTKRHADTREVDRCTSILAGFLDTVSRDNIQGKHMKFPTYTCTTCQWINGNVTMDTNVTKCNRGVQNLRYDQCANKKEQIAITSISLCIEQIGAFAQSRKVTNSIFMSVCPYVSAKLPPNWFLSNLILASFMKIRQATSNLDKIGQNYRLFYAKT
jgi:hypothetical protein